MEGFGLRLFFSPSAWKTRRFFRGSGSFKGGEVFFFKAFILCWFQLLESGISAGWCLFPQAFAL